VREQRRNSGTRFDLAPVRRQIVNPVLADDHLPSLCTMKPAMMRSNVVFPQPEVRRAGDHSPALMSS